MIDDKEIWACAHQVMQQHGERAWLHAVDRATEFRKAYDREGYDRWMRILDRIEQLQRLEPQGGLH